MWSVFEREVKKQPHSTLASLGAKILEVMADLYREVVISSYKKFWSRIEAVIGLEGISLNNCVRNMHLHFS
jgi:hypothetical protein